MSGALQHVRAVVAACPPSEDRDRTAAFLDATADWMAGDDDGHITASAVVLDADAQRTLLIFHRKLGRWLQPGGHVEVDDEDLAAAALREASEETGIAGLTVDPDPIHLDVHWVGTHHHFDVRFIVRAPAGAVAGGANREVEGCRWVAIDELSTLTTEASVVDLVEAAITRIHGTAL
jgi:8-oxo-dGTP pyrophosphatase MutT (NUDIX family)